MKIETQRCFNIPRNTLDLFLVKLKMCDSNVSYFQADYIFENDDKSFDVVVSQYKGRYTYVENDIEKFAKALWVNGEVGGAGGDGRLEYMGEK